MKVNIVPVCRFGEHWLVFDFPAVPSPFASQKLEQEHVRQLPHPQPVYKSGVLA